MMTIVANPRNYKIPEWFLNRQKDYKTGRHTQASVLAGRQAGTHTHTRTRMVAAHTDQALHEWWQGAVLACDGEVVEHQQEHHDDGVPRHRACSTMARNPLIAMLVLTLYRCPTRVGTSPRHRWCRLCVCACVCA